MSYIIIIPLCLAISGIFCFLVGEYLNSQGFPWQGYGIMAGGFVMVLLCLGGITLISQNIVNPDLTLVSRAGFIAFAALFIYTVFSTMVIMMIYGFKNIKWKGWLR